MSGKNIFLLPHSTSTKSSNPRNSDSNTNNQMPASSSDLSSSSANDQENNQLSVDDDFDSYWEEEARNPHRNRIRIGRQYQATVPPMLKCGEKDLRKLEEMETLSFCPKKSAKVSNAELDHYFTVAKSLNLFASLVETRSLLGRDVTIADLNHIRHKEGLSLASVIQPPSRAVSSNQNAPPNLQLSSSIIANNSSYQPGQPSPLTNCEKSIACFNSSSPKNQFSSENFITMNQPLMRALSHFISLHHPCHHDTDCKKLSKDLPLENESVTSVSITSGNLRQNSSSPSKELKPGRSRSSLKQVASTCAQEEDKDQDELGELTQSPSFEDWTREEIELFSKAIEVCGKNFGSIKKEFLPSKSVKSIVEYYYIGSRDVSEPKKRSGQTVDNSDGCSSPEKSSTANNHGGGDGSSGFDSGGKGGPGASLIGSSGSSSTSNRANQPTSSCKEPNKTVSDSHEEIKASLNYHNQQAMNNSSNKSTEKNSKNNNSGQLQDTPNGSKSKSKNIDARMSIYNFDDEFKDESPVKLKCPRPGAEVRPLKAKPIIPNSAIDGSDASNSNVGSLNFFMDGQLVLKLNACQEQQEGIEKCHWVQSGEKVATPSKQKRYTKRAGCDRVSDLNGSHSNSVISSNQDEDSKHDDLSGDEDSKESMNSFVSQQANQQQQQHQSPQPPLPSPQHQQKSNSASPSSKRGKSKIDSANLHQQVNNITPCPIDYNRLALNNRMKERNDTLIQTNPVINQSMPWLQANSFAMAAALLGSLPFPPANNVIENQAQSNMNAVNVNTSKPMDLSLEHNAPKSAPKSSSRSRSRPKNNH